MYRFKILRSLVVYLVHYTVHRRCGIFQYDVANNSYLNNKECRVVNGCSKRHLKTLPNEVRRGREASS